MNDFLQAEKRIWTVNAIGECPYQLPFNPCRGEHKQHSHATSRLRKHKAGETATQPWRRATACRTRCHVAVCTETAAEQPWPLGEQRASAFTAFCYLGPLPSYEQPLRPAPLNHDLESVPAVCCSKPSLDYICAAFVSTCVVVIFQGNALAAAGDILFLQLLVQ